MKRVLLLCLIGGVVGGGIAQVLAARGLAPETTLGTVLMLLVAIAIILVMVLVARRNPPSSADDRPTPD